MQRVQKKWLYIAIIVAIGLLIVTFFISQDNEDTENNTNNRNNNVSDVGGGPGNNSEESSESIDHPMAIESLRRRDYPGSDFVIEETLTDGVNYERHIASYLSEGLRIYGLLTIPKEEMPEGGFPAIVFVHGYIPPDEYSTTRSYPTYQDRLARSGMITFKPDLRGHGDSEGEPVSAHFSEKYVVDTMYAINYLKKHPQVNPDRLGYWGHSNGGEIGLRVILISDDIKAASFWAGVVGSYDDMFQIYTEEIPFLTNIEENDLIAKNGFPNENREFWRELDPYYFLDEIDTAIQLQHGTDDESVPIELSISLKEALEKEGKEVEYIEYEADNHNIGVNQTLAWDRTIDFFEKNL